MAAPKKTATKETGQGNGADQPLEFTREQELSALRDMLLIRRFEEKAGQLYGMGAIGGFCHLYIGQEAIVVGMQMALKQGDQVPIRSIVVGIVLLGLKFAAYWITESSAVFSDAVESIVNVIASLVAFWALSLAHTPPDEKHPYGHGKAEFMAAAGGAIGGGLVPGVEGMLKAAMERVPEKLRGELVIREGLPADQIVGAAREANADVLVIGRHSRGAVGRLILGSTAEAVVRWSDCPVLAVESLPRREAPAAKP